MIRASAYQLGQGGLRYSQMGLERIAKGLEILKASDQLKNFVAIRLCSELSVYKVVQETIGGSNGEPIGSMRDRS